MVTTRNAPPFGPSGGALVYAGEVASVGFRLEQPDGAGGYEPQDLTGRSFALRVFLANGDTPVNNGALIETDDDGDYLAFVITGDQTDDLLPAGLPAIVHAWAFEEIVPEGRQTIATGVFRVEQGSDPTLAAPPAGGGGYGGTIYTLRTDGDPTRTVIFNGAPGASAYRLAVLGGYGGTAEQFSDALIENATNVAQNVAAVNAQGQSSIAAVLAQQTTSSAAVAASGVTAQALVTAEGVAQVSSVTAAGDAAHDSLIGMGATQAGLVSAAAAAVFYPDTTTALAAVAEGAYFNVMDSGAVVLYRKVSGVAVEQYRWPSSGLSLLFMTKQAVGMQGVVADGTTNINTVVYVVNDPAIGDGWVTKFNYFAAGTGLITLQVYRKVNAVWTAIGTAVSFNATLGANSRSLSMPISKGDFLGVKSAGGTLRYTVGSISGLKGMGGGHFSFTAAGSPVAATQPQVTIILAYGHEMVVRTADPKRIVDIRSSSKIAISGDSYSADPLSIRGKGLNQKVSNFSEWRLENAAVSGSTAAINLTNLRAHVLTYSDYPLREYGATYALLRDGENTDANVTIDVALGQWRQIGQSLASMGALPIFGEQHVQIYTAGSQTIFRKLAQEFGSYHFGQLAYTARVYNPTGRAPAFWNGQHYNIRTSEIAAAAISRNVAALLPRPRQGLRFFRPRPGVAIGTVQDLAYDELFDRARLWKEIFSAQTGLTAANEKYLDEINTKTIGPDTQAWSSEYLEMQAGKNVAFADYALMEVIFPSQRMDVVRFAVDPTITVYVQDSDYAGTGYPAPGAVGSSTWRPWPVVDGYVTVSGEDIRGKLFFDKMAFVLYKAGGFTLTTPSVEWWGDLGKVEQPRTVTLDYARGAELLASTVTYASGVIPAAWTQTGSPTASNTPVVGNYPVGITGHALVSSANKIAQTITVTADANDRDLEILVVADYPRALVNSANTYPGTNEVTGDTCDYEQLIVEVTIGAGATVPLKSPTGLWWGEAKLRTVIPAGATSFSIRLSSRADPLAIVSASAKFVVA